MRRIVKPETGGTTINKKDTNKDLWRNAGLFSFLSLNLGFMIVGGYFLGRVLERNYHWRNMTFIGVLVGMFLGLYEMFMIAFKAGSKK